MFYTAEAGGLAWDEGGAGYLRQMSAEISVQPTMLRQGTPKHRGRPFSLWQNEDPRAPPALKGAERGLFPSRRPVEAPARSQRSSSQQGATNDELGRLDGERGRDWPADLRNCNTANLALAPHQAKRVGGSLMETHFVVVVWSHPWEMEEQPDQELVLKRRASYVDAGTCGWLGSKVRYRDRAVGKADEVKG